MKVFIKLFIPILIICCMSSNVVALRELQSVPWDIPSNYSQMVYDTYNEYGNTWQTVSMVTEDMKNKGHTGGEGGQRILSIAISNDAEFLMAGTDVAGIWRSINGGANWEPVYGGFLPTGCFSIAIDPVNSNRVLAFGGSPVGNASENGKNGIYLSEDRGEHWSCVLIQRGACLTRDFSESIVFDPTSYDKASNKCMVAYWSRPWHLQGAPDMTAFKDESKIIKFEVDKSEDDKIEIDKKGLWKTEDGGETWFLVNAEMSDGVVKVNPQDGTVYVGNFNGFHRSCDGGVNFTTVIDDKMIYGLDVIDSYPNRVYINDDEGVKISDDAGVTFKRVVSSNFPASYDITNPERIVRNLKVSPANPQNMVIADFQGSSRYKSQKLYSKDGGVTWNVSSYDATDDFFKANNRDTCYVWHPTNPNKLWAFGGDWVVSSNDAGKTFKWDYNGGSAVCVPSRTIFNVYDPNLFYYGSQDFHGALTTNGGKTWKHIWRLYGEGNSRGWGCVYGAYAADEKTLIALVSTEKQIDGVGSNTGWNGVREIRVSKDGGETWTKTGIYKFENHAKRWSEKCYQSPTDKNVLFAGNFRSADYGGTWEKMSNCSVVQTHNPYGKKELYGSYKNKVVVSYDSGATWETYTKVMVPEEYKNTPSYTVIWDIAYDGIKDILYYISGNSSIGIHLCKVQNGVTEEITDNIVKTDLGKRFHLVSVDPRYPDIVYVGGNGGGGNYIEENSVQRSCDGGKSFQVLSRNGKENSIVKSGIASGFCVRDLIVHPTNGYLWVNNGVRGWSKIAPPYKENEFKNLIKDGDMENGSSKLFYSQYADQNVSYVTDKALTQSLSNKVVCFDSVNSSNALSKLYYDLNIDKGHTYSFSFDYRVDGLQAVDMVTDFGGESKTISATNKWQNVSSTFTATSDETLISICAVSTPNLKYYIDNFKLYDMTDSIKVDVSLPYDCKINCIFGIEEINGQLFANKNSTMKFSIINEDDSTTVTCDDKILNSADGVYTAEIDKSDINIDVVKEMYISKENGLPIIYTGNEKSFVIIVAEKEDEYLKNVICSYYNSNETNKKIVLSDITEFSQITNWENKKVYVWRSFKTLEPLCDIMK